MHRFRYDCVSLKCLRCSQNQSYGQLGNCAIGKLQLCERKCFAMAEPKLLLTDDEYAKIKIRAAREKKTPQKFMRDAVRAALDSDSIPAPTLTPTDSALQTAHTLVKQLDILEARTRELAREVRDAAEYFRGIIDATDDAGSSTRSERMEAAVLRETGAIADSTRAAIAYAAPRDRNTTRDDPRASGPQRVNPRRRSS